jgi:hypothetical protein
LGAVVGAVVGVVVGVVVANFLTLDFGVDVSSDLWAAGGLAFFSDWVGVVEESKLARCVGAGGNGISRGLRWKVRNEKAKKKPPGGQGGFVLDGNLDGAVFSAA